MAVSDLSLSHQVISIGDSFSFSFSLSIAQDPIQNTRKLRVEYAIDFVKLGGKMSRKMFKITENTYSADKPILFSKKHSFEDRTTRKHNSGEHKLTIIINGKEMGGLSFHVTES